MRKMILIFAAMLGVVAGYAETFSYKFDSVNLSEALDMMAEEHTEVIINFIYNELDKYKTSAHINTDDPYEALRQAVGLNPVAVIRRGDRYYVEALQHGRYVYTGQAVGADNKPVVAATVMLLAPGDSSVITYGVTDRRGCFSIPCDRENVIGKFSSVGHHTIFRDLHSFSVGTVIMPLRTIKLGEVKVEVDNASLYPDKSVYVPTSRQKNASQSGTDLLTHMAIPQLGMNGTTTNTGKPVALFIDYLPASNVDLNGMRVADVKRVEYYEYPSDPRLQGNPYVVNFVMQKYIVGGYFKGMGHTNLISNPVVEGTASLRMQYKKMTYDVMGWSLGYDRKHIGEELTETFRLPRESGGFEEFTRYSNTASSEDKLRSYFATLRAAYRSNDIQASTQLSGRIDRQPDTGRSGIVNYTPGFYPSSAYSSLRSDCSRFLSYRGYYFFRLGSNRLTFNPAYTLSHTSQNSLYTEEGFSPIQNGAVDDTHELSATLRFSHSFGDYGNLTGFSKGSYEYNRTQYSGSATALDRARSSRIGVGAQYSVTVGKLYAETTFGWDWDRLQFGDEVDRPSAPLFDASLQYAFNRRHSVTASYEYKSWLPSPSHKSDMIIKASPLLSYTGNPNLSPAKANSYELGYTLVPNNNLSFRAFAWMWTVIDRYVFDYEPTPTGILRTIRQPLGTYAQGQYGLSGTVRLLDRSLVLSGSIKQVFNHNGAPYDVNHFYISWWASARYYIGNWNLSCSYSSPQGNADGFMNGIWVKDRSRLILSAGWGNGKWNVSGLLANPARWHRRNGSQIMHSRYYDTELIEINGHSRAFLQLIATYTIGFGKKVKQSDEPSVSGSASSGILK